MAAITIEYDDREVAAALSRLASTGRDLTPAMRDVAALLEASAQRAFEQQQSPAGDDWDDLSEVTKHRRAALLGPLRRPPTSTPTSSTRSSAISRLCFDADAPEKFRSKPSVETAQTPRNFVAILVSAQIAGHAAD